MSSHFIYIYCCFICLVRGYITKAAVVIVLMEVRVVVGVAVEVDVVIAMVAVQSLSFSFDLGAQVCLTFSFCGFLLLN